MYVYDYYLSYWLCSATVPWGYLIPYMYIDAVFVTMLKFPTMDQTIVNVLVWNDKK